VSCVVSEEKLICLALANFVCIIIIMGEGD